VTKEAKRENKRKSKMMNLNNLNLKLKNMIINLMIFAKGVNGRDFKVTVNLSWESFNHNQITFFKIFLFLKQINKWRT